MQVLEPGSSSKPSQAKPRQHLELDVREEEEARAIAGSAYSLLATAPTETTLYGPGSFRGPIRYLGPGTPVQLFAQYEQTMITRKQKPASLRTFYRIFSSIFISHLKFREKRACQVHSVRAVQRGLEGPLAQPWGQECGPRAVCYTPG